MEKNVQAPDWLSLASPRFHVDLSNQFGIQREGLGENKSSSKWFLRRRKHLVNIAEPLIRDTIKSTTTRAVMLSMKK